VLKNELMNDDSEQCLMNRIVKYQKFVIDIIHL
jgi:hypothetical protein